MKTSILFLLVSFLINLSGYAQIGNLIKDSGVKLLKKEGMNMLSRELHKTKAKFDSTSFNYAISLNDKAAQFESKDKLADVVNLGTMVVDKDKSKTPLEEAREFMDIGEMAYSSNGFKMAELYFIAANAILYTEGYEEEPLYGRGLANLGLLYNSMGRYVAAEEFTVWGLEVREKYRGRNSKDYATSLNNLAVLDKDLGNYNKAEKEITEAININKAILGDESIAYAIGLNNRGVLYQTLGRFEEAEKDMKLTLSVAARTLKTSSLQYTRFQSNLALLYKQKGEYEKAEAIFKEAIEAIAKGATRSKKSNPDYAHMIENLASLYEVMGKPEAAEGLYLEAMDVYARKFDDRYSGYGLTAARLGSLYLSMNDLSKAEKYFYKAEGILNRTFGKQHPYTVDLQVQMGMLFWQKENYAEADNSFSKALDKSLEFVGQYFAPMSDTEKAMYWQTLQPRFEKYYDFAAAAGLPDITKKVLQYRLATKAMLLSGTTKVKEQIMQSGDSTLIKDYQTWLDQKGSLAHYYAMSQEDLQEQKINLDSINRAANTLEKSLSERSGIFSSAYRSSVPTVAEIQKNLLEGEKAVEIIRISSTRSNKVSYLAIILSANDMKKVVLGNGDELESKYFKLYRNLIKYKKEDTYSYAQYWQPIYQALGNPKKVYLSPDGVYNQISINSLQIGEGKYVLDQAEYINISSLRDLITIHDDKMSNRKLASLFGNPEYGSTAIAPLPGTGKEVNIIKNILESSGYATKLEVGTEASENNFKAMNLEGILHVASHAFFVPDPKRQSTSVFSIPLYNVNENVLLRSGVLLAGAGSQAGVINDLNAADNGVLTSYEVINLNLENVDLVVLSACETGLGDLLSGEGVYGLQRAFMIAGTSSVIMSLWKVDDEATQQLMVSFYKNWIRTGDMEQSFRGAQKEVRTQFRHPYYWGSFVLLKN
jgi:CHAT domain-containing protein